MGKNMTFAKFLEKYAMDENFKTLRESAKASSGKQKAELEGRMKRALKNSTASNIAKKEQSRYKQKLPSPDVRRQLDFLTKFRRNLEVMQAKTNRMMAGQKNDSIALYLIDLESLLTKGISKANEMEKHLKQINNVKPVF